MTQCDMILKHLEERVGLDPLEAETLYGCRRLAARIADLRGRGYNILSLRKEVYNRFGEKRKVAEYRLVKESL